MKTHVKNLFLVLTWLVSVNHVAAQGTAFIYQGQLVNGGLPANGLYDVRFTVCDAVTNGNIITGPLTNTATGVSNGLFAVTLDFGGVAFTGPARWLQLDIRTNGNGAFISLSPREPVMPVPYAILANNASNLLGTLPVAKLGGTLALGQLPTAVVTNNETGVTLGGTFSGNGNGLAGLNPANLSAGTAGISISGNAATATTAVNVTGNIADAQLSANIPRLNGTNNFTGTNNFAGVTVAANANNVFNGSFSGNGGGLTNLNATTPSTINESSITIGATNVIAPLTVPPNVPASPIGSVATGSEPISVAVAGRYAYVVSEGANTLQVFDVSTPSGPVSVGSVTTGSQPTSVAVAGRYAYVVMLYGILQIFDVSNPSAPVFAGATGTGSEPNSVAVAGRYAYVANEGGTLQIFDVSNPSGPASVGSVSTASRPWSVAVAGRYAYVLVNASLNPGTLQIFDVSNPLSPVSVGSVATGSGPLSFAVAGRYAYVANYNANTLQIFDVSNPASPVSVGSVGTGSNPQSIAVAGRYAYVVSYGGGLQVFDVSAPSAPVNVGSVVTGGYGYSVAVAGRYAYMANYNANTLQVCDLGGAYIQQLEAGALETGTLQTRDTVTVGNNLNVRGGLTASGSALVNGGLSVNGSVGIGVSAPSYTLQVNGSVAGVGAYNNLSDARYKTNITTLDHALDKVMAMRGVKYDWRIADYPQLRFDAKPQLGFIAQEVKGILPEAVSQDAQGNYSIAYSEVIPVLVEAVKDQQMEITNKDAEIQDLKQSVEELKKLFQSLPDKK
jgi:hypothetical protein